MKEMLVIIVSAILVENFVLTKFLGICPFLGVSKSLSSALGMSVAVVFVMTIASGATWVVNEYLLKSFGIEYLQTIAFILVIAALVQFVEIVLKKTTPSLYKSLGIYLPLITTNCAVLGVSLLNIGREYNFLQSIVYGFGAGLGFTFALVLFSGVREKLETCDIPEALKGLPITLIAAALVSLAFFGFQGLFTR
ncbi:MAG TPA: electron transport complex subunit RsxA [Clostridiaceae bacterium]|jgi:electron transport complex protein RnfA|nr:electron transport complex subunit RsxA [Clostridiaceae bacterium]